MKKEAVICTLVAFILIVAGLFIFSDSPIKPDDIYIQHLIYAPTNSVVTFDGEKTEYDENLRCYPVIVTKTGKHSISVTHEGCSPFEQEITVTESGENNITQVNLEYTAEFVSEGEKVAGDLIEKLIKKCWNLDTDYSDLNFLNEEDKKNVTTLLESITEALEAELSAEYTVNNLRVMSRPFSNNKTAQSCRYDGDDSSMLFAFLVEYTFAWNYKSETYEDSGIEAISAQPYIAIERVDGVWYIRELDLSVSNRV